MKKCTKCRWMYLKDNPMRFKDSLHVQNTHLAFVFNSFHITIERIKWWSETENEWEVESKRWQFCYKATGKYRKVVNSSPCILTRELHIQILQFVTATISIVNERGVVREEKEIEKQWDREWASDWEWERDRVSKKREKILIYIDTEREWLREWESARVKKKE